MSLKKIIVSAALFANTLNFSGCSSDMPDSYIITQKEADNIAKSYVKIWESMNSSYINVHSLLREGRYDEAEKVLEIYLKQQIISGEMYLDNVKSVDTLSNSVVDDIELRIEKGIKKIGLHLSKETL